MQTSNKSLLAAFGVISSEGEVSRKDISDSTGFSQVTVGKAVDILERAGIVSCRKKESGHVGRKCDICALENRHGMILFDLSKEISTVGVYDIKLNCISMEEVADASTLMIEGLGKFSESGLSQLMGVGCVCPAFEIEKSEKLFLDALGNLPDVAVEEFRAHTLANQGRFDCDSGLFARIFSDGGGDCAVIIGGEILVGSHGRAGIFSRGEGVSGFTKRVGELAASLDVSLINISCADDEMCGEVSLLLKGFFDGAEYSPKIVVENINSVKLPIEGLAMLIREKFLLKLIENQ